MGDTLTENTPPVPPAPEHPYANWPQPGQGQNYPSHGPYGPPQPYTPPGYVQQPQYAYPPQQGQYQAQPYPQHYGQPYGQQGWGGPQKPGNGMRTASGVLTIVMGAWTLLCAFSGFGGGKPGLATFLFLTALAAVTAGILVLTLRRNKGVQIFALTSSGLAALLALIGPLADYYGIVLPFTLLPLAATATIFSAISLSRENRRA